MELKVEKNIYGYHETECPFCGAKCYYREKQKDPLMDLHRHMVNQAKNEALVYVIEPGAMGKHLTYFKDHAKERSKVVTTSKFEFDNDIIIKTE